MTGDKQKTDIERMRRTRNHRPTRKRETRCYGHKDKRKKVFDVTNIGGDLV